MLGVNNKVYVKDIRDWEDTHHINILRLFDKIGADNVISIITVINKCDYEIASDILDNLLVEHDIVEIYNELRNVLLGYDYSETFKNKESTDDEDIVNNIYDDVSKYKYLSEYYMHVCMQLMSLGLSYTEFWSLCTKEIYQVFSAINQKQLLDYNKQIQINYATAALIGGAVWGKLPKQAPTLKMSDIVDEDTIIDTEFGEMTLGEYKSARALFNLGGGIDECKQYG